MPTTARFLWIAAIAAVFLFSHSAAKGEDGKGGHGKHRKLWELLSSLSPDDRAKLHAARAQALQDPAVRAAKEQRDKAEAEYRELLDREILKIDPSLKPLLDTIASLKKHNDL